MGLLARLLAILCFVALVVALGDGIPTGVIGVFALLFAAFALHDVRPRNGKWLNDE